jgi:hypothetical protein
MGASDPTWEGPPSQQHEDGEADDAFSGVLIIVPLVGAPFPSSHEAVE